MDLTLFETGLSHQTLASLQQVFSQYQEIETVILYGSRAQNSHKPHSDIDLTLKGKNLNLRLLSKVATDIDDLLLPYHCDLSLFDQLTDQSFIAEINKTGIPLYQKNHPPR